MRVLSWVCGIAGAGLLAGTAGAQDWIEIRFGTVNPPGGMGAGRRDGPVERGAAAGAAANAYAKLSGEE